MEFLNEDFPPSNTVLGTNQVINHHIFLVILIFFVILSSYFGSSMFIAICVCKPIRRRKFTISNLILHIISALILLTSSLIYFVGISKLNISTKTIPDVVGFNYKKAYLKHYPFEENILKLNNLYKNTKQYIHFINQSMESLEQISHDFNENFIHKSSNYLISFYNPRIKNNIEKNLNNIDTSRNSILSIIQSFRDYYNELLISMKEQLAQFNQKILIPSKKAMETLTENITFVPGYFNKYESDNDIFEYNSVNCLIGYIVAGCIIIVIIIYIPTFFFANCCTRFLYGSFSIYAYAILFFVGFSGLYLSEFRYGKIVTGCGYIEYYNYMNDVTAKRELKSVMNSIMLKYKNFSKYSYNIENKLNFIHLNNVHKNFQTRYSRNHQFNKYLNELISENKMNEKKLTQVKTIFKNVNKYMVSVYSNIQEIEINSIELINKINDSFILSNNRNDILDKKEICEKLNTGCLCCIIAAFFLFFGLFIFSISICIRRRDMAKFNKVTSKMETSKIGVKRVHFMAYINYNEVNIQGFIQKGIFGSGFYFSVSQFDAIYKFIHDENNEIDYNNMESTFAFFTFDVDFGRALLVPPSLVSTFKFPNTLNEYFCDSVIGHLEGNIDEYVVFQERQIKYLGYEAITLREFLEILNSHE